MPSTNSFTSHMDLFLWFYYLSDISLIPYCDVQLSVTDFWKRKKCVFFFWKSSYDIWGQ